LPGISFRDFASNNVPARIVSNEIAKRCIIWSIKTDYSFSSFRRSRLVHRLYEWIDRKPVQIYDIFCDCHFLLPHPSRF
jgi:hypothetical protein